MLNTLSAEVPTRSRRVQNQVLSTLNEDDFELMRPFLRVVALKRHKIVFDANARVNAVYFVESGIVSRLATTPADGAVEVGVVGRFGFVGISVVLGSDRALHRTVVTVPGEALCISAEDLRIAMTTSPRIREHLLRYVQILIGLKAQVALCNAKHSIDQRVARWLLLARDRMACDELPVTHDFLAKALGVRRPGISAALATLESDGAISKHRAAIRIEHKDLVQLRSCECYGIIEHSYASMRKMQQFEHYI